MLFTLLALSFSLPEKARAEPQPTSYCRPGKRILEKVDHCEDNAIYVRQAKECREALEKDVARTSAGLQKLLAGGGEGSQSANFAAALKDYGTTGAQLDQLILLATLAARDVAAYEDFVAHPEDIENPDIAGSDPQKFADSVPCYADTMKGIKENAGLLEKMKAQLIAARAATASLGGQSGKRQEAIQAGPASGPSASEGAKAVTPAAGFTTRQKDPNQSDISGTKDVKKGGR